MEIQLQELIDKIKKDGIVSASEEASRLKSEAESDARRIVESARSEAEGIIAKAKADAERFEKAGVAALEQASRNLILAFKGEIEALLDKIIAFRVSASYGDDALKAIIPELVKNWASKGADSLDLILSEDSLTKLRGYFTGQLAAEINKGVELKSGRNLGDGFRIASKDGSAYYDFSAESVAALLSAYLNPRLSEILKKTVKEN
ncbi:MAG: V-type ATP synthase subunit E [Treponema sp.]|jgi:V/A-type H+-transporting ATPase subunit E|nr:V-type ATP synthase subunit E [Treponema sp.]